MSPSSSSAVFEAIATELQLLVRPEGKPLAAAADRFTTLLGESITVSDDAPRPSRGIVVDGGGGEARLVRWSNVRFHWLKVAAAAADIAIAFQTAHSEAFWFVKAFQVFLQLKNVRDLPLPERVGLSYWAMWTSRDLDTKEVRKDEALAAAWTVFVASGQRAPDELEFASHVEMLALHQCLELHGERIRLRETVEFQR